MHTIMKNFTVTWNREDSKIDYKEYVRALNKLQAKSIIRNTYPLAIVTKVEEIS